MWQKTNWQSATMYAIQRWKPANPSMHRTGSIHTVTRVRSKSLAQSIVRANPSKLCKIEPQKWVA